MVSDFFAREEIEESSNTEDFYYNRDQLNNENNNVEDHKYKRHYQDCICLPIITVFSPRGVLSPPALASTPSTGTSGANRFYGKYTRRDNARKNGPSRSKHLDYDLTELPVVVLDKVFAILPDQDLRAFHQVSYAWKTCLEIRNGDNSRRLHLVRKIRENKENILNRSKGQQVNYNNRINRAKEIDLKPGSQLLTECTNNIQNRSDANSSQNTTAGNILTPTSRFPFQSFQECEKGLKKGQKLFQCRRCKGPVPSPILPAGGSEEDECEKNAKAKKIEATRCRLTSRMGTKRLPVRKKAKTTFLMLNPMSPKTPNKHIDIPTTIKLDEIMSQSLVISNRVNISTSPSSNIEDLGQSVLPHANETALTTGIDLNSNRISDINSITYKLNLINDSPNSNSFGMLREPDSQMSNTNPEFKDSAISDLSIHSFHNKSSFFSNLIMSPDLSTKRSKSTVESISKLKQDFVKPITLNISTDEPYSQIHFDIDKPEKSANKIKLSTHESHIKYVIISTHEKSMIGTNIDFNMNPLLACNDQNSNFSKEIGTSDYLSFGSNKLRDSCSSYIPQMSPSKLDFYHRTEDESTSNDNFKSMSQSLQNILDSSREISFQSYESTTSLPNLNESFILECPNPSCSFRFCSSCGDVEHPNKMCHIIDSESFEAFNMSSDVLQCKKLSQNNLNAGENGRKGKGQSVPIKGVKSSKEKLRRLARL